MAVERECSLRPLRVTAREGRYVRAHLVESFGGGRQYRGEQTGVEKGGPQSNRRMHANADTENVIYLQRCGAARAAQR